MNILAGILGAIFGFTLGFCLACLLCLNKISEQEEEYMSNLENYELEISHLKQDLIKIGCINQSTEDNNEKH